MTKGEGMTLEEYIAKLEEEKKQIWDNAGKLSDTNRELLKENKSLKASRDYWREKAESNAKENAVLKGKLENAYLELKIWSNGIADYKK